MHDRPLQPTSWLAKRLGLSISTVERLRAHGSDAVPPHVVVGNRSVRYDAATVDAWIAERMGAAKPAFAPTAPLNGCVLRRVSGRLVVKAPDPGA